MDTAQQQSFKQRYREIREANKKAFLGFGSEYPASEMMTNELQGEAQKQRYEEYWRRGGLHFMGVFVDLMLDPAANDVAADFVRGKIDEAVDDAEVAKKLMPSQTLGCKRLCSDTNYYATFNRPNVSLVDVNETPIDAFTETGLLAGEAYSFDAVVFATGFDAMTGSLDRIDIRGRAGEKLVDKWAEGPKNYLGLGYSGFPNFFIVAGPGSPSVLTNMVPSIEMHVEWIAQCIDYLRDKSIATIEATPEAEAQWVEHTNEMANFTLYGSCNSWYLGANIPGKPRVFMPYIGYPMYLDKCAEVAANGYEGFVLS